MNIGAFLGRLAAAAVLASTTLGYASHANADTWERIQQEKKFVIGTEARFPPFEFVEGGKIVGYTQDVLTESWQRRPVEVQPGPPVPGA